MKKTLSLILALLMSLSTAAVAFAEDDVIVPDVEEDVTTDVETEEEEVVAGPYDEALEYLATYKILQGNGNENYGAADMVQRAQMALFAARISTGWVEDAKWSTANYTDYTDIEGTWAESVIGAITYADENGIIKGVGENRFAPTANVTYQDALTMVVRTLGYTNLNYPWGFITKAIELGLTEGIEEGLRFTDEINRGVTAQIIYNALMAPLKDNGGTLALKSFGAEFGWEDVVITMSAKDVLLGTDKKAGAGKVGFQRIVDGELEDEVYYTAAANFELDVTKYEDITAVGKSYRVFFEKTDDGLVKMFGVKPNYVETLWNAEGETGIKAAFDAKKYALVEKYGSGRYDVENYWTDDAVGQIKVIDALGGIDILVDSKTRIGIDFATDNIVEYSIQKDADGKEYAKIEKTLWWYNDVKDMYYTIIVKADGEEIGIKYMDAEEEAKLLAALDEIAWTKKTVLDRGFANLVNSTFDKNSAYASLEVYAVEGNYYGIYEEYRFGEFKNVVIDEICSHNKKVDAYAIYNVFAMADPETVIGAKLPEAFVKAPVLKDAGCDHCKDGKYVTAWINPEFAANYEDGEYLDGYVIYSADNQTGEVKIVKYIGAAGTEYATEDDYVAYGTVRAYDVETESVRINGVPYTFNYDNLEGNELINVSKDDAIKYKEQYSDNLRDWLNQYVKYVVLDGEIVHMEIASVTNKDEAYFIVERYAGVSSDGYIVVDGYYVNKDGVQKLTQARIATVNNAYTGDLFYYLTKEKIAESFTTGVVYFVSSVNEEGALNVQLAWEDGELSDFIKGETTGFTVAWLADRTVERSQINFGTKTTDYAANDTRTYILIGEDAAKKTVVRVYTGKLEANWTVTGTKLDIDSAVVLVGVDFADVVGFNKNTASTGLVALVDDHYWAAEFDGANMDDEWYLLGASEYNVNVFDFTTGSYVEKAVRNLDLKEGYLYNLTGGTIVYDKKTAAGDYDETNKVYDEDISEELAKVMSDYAFGAITLETKYDDDDALISFTKDNGYVEKLIADTNVTYNDATKKVFAHRGYSKDWGDIVTVKSVALITLGNKKDVAIIKDIDADFTAAELADLKKDATTVSVDGFFFVNVNTGDARVYVFANEVEYENEDVELAGKDGIKSNEVIIASKDNWEESKDAYIEVVADVTVDKENGKIVDGVVDSITLQFAGDKVASSNHKTIYANSYYFGEAGKCDKENWSCTLDGADVYDKYVTATVYEEHDTEDVCNLIDTITIDFEKALDFGKEYKITMKNSFGVSINVNLLVEVVEGKVVVHIGGPAVSADSSYGEFKTLVYRASLA